MAYVGVKYTDRSTQIYELNEYLGLPDDPGEIDSVMLHDLTAMVEWANQHHRLAPPPQVDEKYIAQLARMYTKYDEGSARTK